MKSRGFSYVPVRYKAAESDRSTWGDVDHARTNGYGFNFSDQPDNGGADADPDDQTVGMSDAQRAAWLKALQGGAGTPDANGNDPDSVQVQLGDATTYFSKSSCRTYANEQVDGDLVAWVTAQGRFEDLANEVTTRTDADPRVVESKRKWSECMRGRGYPFSDPNEAPLDVSQRVQSKELTEEQGKEEEIKVAVADAECVNSVDALRTRTTVVAEMEAAVRERSENDILAFQELQQKSIERANALAQAR